MASTRPLVLTLPFTVVSSSTAWTFEALPHGLRCSRSPVDLVPWYFPRLGPITVPLGEPGSEIVGHLHYGTVELPPFSARSEWHRARTEV